MSHANSATPTETNHASRLATVPKIASDEGLTAWQVYELIRQDKLPPGVVVRFGPRTTRINRAKWEEFVEQGGLGR